MTLPKAIHTVLRKARKPITVCKIADEINTSGLKKRKDGMPFNTYHICRCLNRYPELFYMDSLYFPQLISLVED
jgi:hypothetical protein